MVNIANHHKACPYRERYDKMETALQIIFIWSKAALETAGHVVGPGRLELKAIRDKAHEALHYLDEAEKRKIEKKQ